ncbi:MAG TPA: hypothetical protein DCE78_11475 [Bacteroidetes bacterium]|nr:hypothetical protein [Bacteroidota bacterium]
MVSKNQSPVLKLSKPTLSLIYLTLLILISSCATPVAPTGGELDRSGPILVTTNPINATTNFTGDEIRFTFDDFVDRNSFRNAFNVEPDIDLDFDIKWRRKTAIIKFNESLPDSTTLIFSIGNELRDTRSNRLSTPINLAISTGDIIDSQKVTFRILPSQPGILVTEPRIFLYREPVDLTLPAFYTGGADTSGVVRFNYLSEGEYRAILVHDINRNRIWDRDREFAQPFENASFNINEIDTNEVQIFNYAKRDTLSPTIQGIGLLDDSRLRIRFSKAIKYDPENSIDFVSSDSIPFTAIHLYNDPREDFVSYFHSMNPLNDDATYQVISSNISDNLNNRLRLSNTLFDGSSAADTTTFRYVGAINTADLLPDDTLSIRYNKIITDPNVIDSLKIYVNRSEAKGQFNVSLSNNILLIHPNNEWIQADAYEIKTWDPSIAAFRDLRPTIINDLDLGEFQILISDSTLTDLPLTVRLYNRRNQLIINQAFQNEILLKQIPKGSYHLSIFYDPDLSGQWDFGQVDPFQSPSFMYIDRNFPIRSRMTSELILE